MYMWLQELFLSTRGAAYFGQYQINFPFGIFPEAKHDETRDQRHITTTEDVSSQRQVLSSEYCQDCHNISCADDTTSKDMY